MPSNNAPGQLKKKTEKEELLTLHNLPRTRSEAWYSEFQEEEKRALKAGLQRVVQSVEAWCSVGDQDCM